MSKFNQTSLNRLLNHHTENGYVVVSACRADWVTNDKLKNRQMNNIKTKELKQDIYDSGYQYIPVSGGFIEEDGTEVRETSFIIVNYKNKSGNGEKVDGFNELKTLAIDLCDKYNQMSVLVVEPGKNPTYYTKNGDVDFELSGNVTVRDATQKFFTHIGGGKRFSFIEQSRQPGCISEIRSRKMKGEICEMCDYDSRRN